MKEELCDFCGAPNPTRDFACEAFTIPELPMAFEEAWGACDACAALIDADRWGELLDRAVAAQVSKFGILGRLAEPVLRENTKKIYAELRRRRVQSN